MKNKLRDTKTLLFINNAILALILIHQENIRRIFSLFLRLISRESDRSK